MIEFVILLGLPLAAVGLCYVIQNTRIQYFLSLAIAAAHLTMSYLIFSGLYVPAPFEYVRYDALSKLFLLILSHVYFWVTLISLSYLSRPVIVATQSGRRLYFMMLNLFVLANTAAIISNHFGLYWVASETTTLSVAPLIYYYRNEEALEAMWKYLFLVSVGIALAFIGILFLALSAKGTYLEGEQLFMSTFFEHAKELNPIWLKASFIFVFVGLSTKIGIAPMHPGDIDATSNAPSPIAALMSGSLRGTALIGVMRLYQLMIPTGTAEFASIILITGGVFSLFVAFVFMFKVTNFKRMLAYSSVEHLGLITLGIGTGGLAFAGAMLHTVFNSLTKMVLFFNAGNIHRRYKTREVHKVFSVLNQMPWTGWLFLFSFLAIVAMPPFGIFFSELMIFEGLVATDHLVLLSVVLFFLFFIFVGMGKTIFRMLYVSEKQERIELERETIHIEHFVSLILLAMLIGLGVFMPDLLYRSILDISRDFGINL